MVKLTILYKKPENPQAFDEYYLNVHMPLAAKLPGLVKHEVAKVSGSPMGESPFHVITELYFNNVADLQAAMVSPEGKATARDVNNFAKGLSEMHISELVGVPSVSHA